MPESNNRDARGRILDALRREPGALQPSQPDETISEFSTSRYGSVQG